MGLVRKIINKRARLFGIVVFILEYEAEGSDAGKHGAWEHGMVKSVKDKR